MSASNARTASNPLTVLRVVWRLLFVILLGMSGVLLWRAFDTTSQPGSPDRLPVHQTVPDFRLLAHSGQAFGRIWVANFVFTRCPGVCPLLSSRMAQLQTRLEETDQPSIRLVSFSVDPEWDTPQRLSGYADRYSADASRWVFLTGELSVVQPLVRDGFQLAMMNAPPEGSHTSHGQPKRLEQIVHSDRFVLVDPEFRIRAYYRGDETAVVERVMRDIEILRHEYPPVR
ncbi:MAG: SCO family protein [Desulfurellaceae bacterium]|nr:SCO family protein [Desulfurellaceae bacterium]